MYDAALLKAVRCRRLDNVRVMIETLGARLECHDGQGRTPFLVACGHSAEAAWYLLTEAGADVTATDHDGLTALHWAACAGHCALCAAILQVD